jgi:hypothetical protein
MLKKYIILWLFFQLLVETNCQKTPFKPAIRTFHTATLIGNKLYFVGGLLNITADGSVVPVGKEFFYLDVSSPFNTKELLWQDLSSIYTVPFHAGAAAVKGGANNNTLFLYGGVVYGSTAAAAELVYTFDTQSNTWSIPTIAGVNTIRKNSLTSIIGYNGKMYLWGGIADEVGVNSMLILDTIKLSWEMGSLVDAPTPRSNYGAVLLPDQTIIYMGKQII